jgi:adhesin HecA-like repeat protein
MKNITELNKHLTDLYQALKDGTVDVKTAAEMNNTAGKIINVQKVQLEYAALRNAAPTIPFLDNGDGK